MKLLTLAAAFVGGVALAFGVGGGLPLVSLALFGAAALAAALLLRLAGMSALPALAMLALTLGMVRLAIDRDDTPPPNLASSAPVEAIGVAQNDLDSDGNFGRFRMRMEQMRIDGGQWRSTQATLLVSARIPAELAAQRRPPYVRYGDRVQAQGQISEPANFDDFDYVAYLARQGISEVMHAEHISLAGESEGSTFYHRLHELRQRLASSIAASVPEPQAALGQATLLGMRRNIPTELTEAFRRTGTSHLLAISGLHVGILLASSLAVSAALLGRRHHLHLIAPLLVIWGYGLLSGMSPSAVRACIMGSVLLATMAFGRQRGALAPLGLAAAVMVAITPNVLHSISFQLSFTAVAGIAALSPALSGAMRALMLRQSVQHPSLRGALAATADMLGVSLAATAATLPLIAYHFERVSTLGVPATLLTLPAVPIVVVGSAIVGLLGLIHEALAMPFGWVVWGAGAYINAVVTLLAKLPIAALNTGKLTPTLVMACYAALMLAFVPSRLFPQRIRRLWQRTSSHADNPSPPAHRTVRGDIAIWLLVPAAFAAGLVFTGALTQDDRLSLTFVDVGQGDGVFIETPSGVQIVVDGGGQPERMVQFLGERMRFADRRIDIVAATHPHEDHIGGLPQVLARYDVHRILERRIAHDSPAYAAWRRAVDSEDAEHIDAQSQQQILLDDGVRIETLWPPETLPTGAALDANNAAIVLRVVYGDVSILLTSDIEAETERALLATGVPLDSDALKVAHHGSGGSTTRAFLDAVSPIAAVISVGADNRYGHPDDAVVAALRETLPPGMLFTTAEHGSVELLTDGKTLWVRTKR